MNKTIVPNSGGKIHNLNEYLRLPHWPLIYWILFYGVIPLFLYSILVIYQLSLPGQISANGFSDQFNQTFILYENNIAFSSIFLMNYTHQDFSSLFNNLIIYLISITLIFVLEKNKRSLIYISSVILIGLPFVFSIASLLFYRIIQQHMPPALGFSGIVYAFLGYFVYLFVRIFYDNSTDLIQHRNISPNTKNISNILIFFVIFLFVIIPASVLGQFISQNNVLSNGLAHFIGFIAGIMIASLVGIFDKYSIDNLEKYLIISVIFTTIWYIIYLSFRIP